MSKFVTVSGAGATEINGTYTFSDFYSFGGPLRPRYINAAGIALLANTGNGDGFDWYFYQNFEDNNYYWYKGNTNPVPYYPFQVTSWSVYGNGIAPVPVVSGSIDSTALGYNSGSTLTGTQQIGSLAVVTATTANPSLSPNGVKFWMGPDESFGYVIGVPVSGGTQPTPVSGVNASLAFLQSTPQSEYNFIYLVNTQFNQNFGFGSAAKAYLNNTGNWTSYTNTNPYGNPSTLFDFSQTSFYANTGTTIADLSGNGNNGIMCTGTNIPFDLTTVQGYNTNGYLNLPGSVAQLSVAIPFNPFGVVPFTYVIHMRPKGLSYNGIDTGIIASSDGGSFFWLLTTGQTFNLVAVRNFQDGLGMNFTGGTGFNVWSTYTLRFDGGTTTMFQYEGGVLYSASTVGATSLPYAPYLTLGLRLNQWVNADFNYVAIYSTALNNSEVLSISQFLSGRTPT
jgi:hypothetical protein